MDIGHSDAELNKFRKPEKNTLLIFCVNCILKITLIAVVLKKNGLCMKYYHSYLFFYICTEQSYKIQIHM